MFNKGIQLIQEQFKGCEIKFIRAGEPIREAAVKASEHFTHIIACGGDGTANRVAAALAGTKTIMGILPFGSGNDFAKAAGLTRNWNQNLNILKQNRIREVDIIQMGPSCMINTFGLGLDGLINYYAAKSKIKPAFWRYLFSGLKALLVSKKFKATVTLNETEHDFKTWMITVANGSTEGGRYKISPTSNHADGHFEVIVVKPVFRIRLITEFIRLSFGFSFNPSIVDILSCTNKTVIRTKASLKAHYDGEQIQNKQAYSFILQPKALRLVTA